RQLGCACSAVHHAPAQSRERTNTASGSTTKSSAKAKSSSAISNVLVRFLAPNRTEARRTQSTSLLNDDFYRFRVAEIARTTRHREGGSAGRGPLGRRGRRWRTWATAAAGSADHCSTKKKSRAHPDPLPRPSEQGPKHRAKREPHKA